MLTDVKSPPLPLRESSAYLVGAANCTQLAVSIASDIERIAQGLPESEKVVEALRFLRSMITDAIAAARILGDEAAARHCFVEAINDAPLPTTTSARTARDEHDDDLCTLSEPCKACRDRLGLGGLGEFPESWSTPTATETANGVQASASAAEEAEEARFSQGEPVEFRLAQSDAWQLGRFNYRHENGYSTVTPSDRRSPASGYIVKNANIRRSKGVFAPFD